MTKGGRVREDGRVVRDMLPHARQRPQDSRGEWDLLEVVKTIPGDQAFRPLAETPVPAGQADLTRREGPCGGRSGECPRGEDLGGGLWNTATSSSAAAPPAPCSPTDSRPAPATAWLLLEAGQDTPPGRVPEEIEDTYPGTAYFDPRFHWTG